MTDNSRLRTEADLQAQYRPHELEELEELAVDAAGAADMRMGTAGRACQRRKAVPAASKTQRGKAALRNPPTSRRLGEHSLGRLEG